MTTAAGFEWILKEFEQFFHCTLQPDQVNSCLIRMPNGPSIQLELSRMGQVMVGCRIGTLPLSKYRENLFREALKSNESTPPSQGVFGFSQKTNNLFLFLTIDPDHLNQELISRLIPPFLEKAKLWSEAILNGKIPAIDQGGKGLQSPMSIFGSNK